MIVGSISPSVTHSFACGNLEHFLQLMEWGWMGDIPDVRHRHRGKRGTHTLSQKALSWHVPQQGHVGSQCITQLPWDRGHWLLLDYI